MKLRRPYAHKTQRNYSQVKTPQHNGNCTNLKSFSHPNWKNAKHIQYMPNRAKTINTQQFDQLMGGEEGLPAVMGGERTR